MNKNSKAPPVDSFSVTAVQNNFGREVFGRPTEGPCSITNSFSESEISKFYMTRSGWIKILFKIWTLILLNKSITKNVLIIENEVKLTYKDIFRLEVAIDYIFIMQIYEGVNYFSGVKSRGRLIETAIIT